MLVLHSGSLDNVSAVVSVSKHAEDCIQIINVCEGNGEYALQRV